MDIQTLSNKVNERWQKVMFAQVEQDPRVHLSVFSWYAKKLVEINRTNLNADPNLTEDTRRKINVSLNYLKNLCNIEQIKKQSPGERFIKAVETGDLDLFEASIAEGANVNQEIDNCAPLVHAAKNRQFNILDRLLELPHVNIKKYGDQAMSVLADIKDDARAESARATLKTKMNTEIPAPSLQDTEKPSNSSENNKSLKSEVKQFKSSLTMLQTTKIVCLIQQLEYEKHHSIFYSGRKQKKIDALNLLLTNCEAGMAVGDAVQIARKNHVVTRGFRSKTDALLTELEHSTIKSHKPRY